MKNKKTKKQSAGRKPLPKGERKVMIRIFPTEQQVENCGGTEQAKLIALASIIDKSQTIKSDNL